MNITPSQIKKIHALKNALAMDDEQYRAMIMEAHGFSGTSKDLSMDEATTLIDRLESSAVAAGVWENRGQVGAKKYEDLGKRSDQWATPKQCRMVEAMFRAVSIYKGNEKAFKHAFRNFLTRIAKVDDVRYLEKRDVQKVVLALKRMKMQKKETI